LGQTRIHVLEVGILSLAVSDSTSVQEDMSLNEIDRRTETTQHSLTRWERFIRPARRNWSTCTSRLRVAAKIRKSIVRTISRGAIARKKHDGFCVPGHLAEMQQKVANYKCFRELVNEWMYPKVEQGRAKPSGENSPTQVNPQ
jgi:hypothetical protein